MTPRAFQLFCTGPGGEGPRTTGTRARYQSGEDRGGWYEQSTWEKAREIYLYSRSDQLFGAIHELMERYANLPIDLTDASLVVAATELGKGRILSTDQRDFETYRWKDAQPGEEFICLIGIGKHGNMRAHEQGLIGLMMGSLNGILLSSLVAVEVSGTRAAEAAETENKTLLEVGQCG